MPHPKIRESDVSCPRCGADPGVSCHAQTGRVVRYHKQRSELAQSTSDREAEVADPPCKETTADCDDPLVCAAYGGICQRNWRHRWQAKVAGMSRRQLLSLLRPHTPDGATLGMKALRQSVLRHIKPEDLEAE